MVKSQPAGEGDVISQPIPVNPTLQANAVGIENSDQALDKTENILPNEGMKVAHTILVTVGEGLTVKAMRPIGAEQDEDGDPSEIIDFAVSLMEQFMGDLSLPNLDSVILLFRQVLKQCPETHPLHLHALCGLASGLGLLFVHIREQKDYAEFLGLGRRIQALKPNLMLISGDDDDTGLKETLGLAQTRLANLCKAASLSSINISIFLLEGSLAVLSPGHPKQPLALASLTYAKYIQSVHPDNESDNNSATSMRRNDAKVIDGLHDILEMAGRVGGRSISVGANTARKHPTEHILQSGGSSRPEVEGVSWLIYSQNLVDEFGRSGKIGTLEDAIASMRLGLMDISIMSPNYVIGLNELANALITRFKHRGDARDRDESISIHRQVLKITPSLSPNYSTSLNNLAISLSTRFEQQGDPKDLDESIVLHREALDKADHPHHPNHARSLGSLATTLLIRFEHQGRAQDLEECISLHRRVLVVENPLHPDHSDSFNNIANAVWTRFTQLGDPKDLGESISFHLQALKLRPPPHPKRSSSLNNLAIPLMSRFEHQGDAEDIDKSISFLREAVEFLPSTHALRPGSLNNLALALRIRFATRSDPQDLDESISSDRQALELFRPPHPNRSASLNNLANALSTRFDRRGAPEDLDESIAFHRQAVELEDPFHPFHSTSLNSLGCALWRRFKRRGDAKDLDESILFHTQALILRPPPHPNRSSSLDDLAIALRTQFEYRGESDVQDLDKSISLHRQALELRPPPHIYRSASLNNLAAGLVTRFKLRCDTQDLNESISFNRQALDLRPLSHPNHTSSLYNLASALATRFENGHDANDLEEAMLLFSEAARSPYSSSSIRFRHARVWAQYADLNQHLSAIEAFDVVLGLLPGLAALGLDIQSRQDYLATGTDGIAREAARCAIRVRDLDKAVQFLEIGRSVFWSQFLSLRSPLDKLQEVAPQLDKDLRRISKELEEGSHRHKSTDSMSNQQKLSWETEAKQFELLAKKWKETVNQVQELQGFEDFLQPPTLSKLQTATERGPVVYLIANSDVSNCLIMTSTLVHHIPLLDLPAGVLSVLVEFVRLAASSPQISRSVVEGKAENGTDIAQGVLAGLEAEEERGMKKRGRIPGHVSSDDIFKYVLRKLWEEVVKHVIDFLGLQKSRNLPTLTWCATGLFSFLPIHAAGCYDAGLVDCTSDYVISTYTPIIGVLLAPDPPPMEPFKVMAVIESSSLPSTREELLKIEQYVAGDSLIKFGTPGTQASIETVASRLSAASIVHFACHGKQDSVTPLESGLEIGGKRLTIARIMKELVPNGSLAFLSACETAMGDKKIPDEAMNIGASLLFTGFRSVVATMWRMWDEDGPVITDAFYRELFKGPDGNLMSLPDTSKSAKALAIAVNELRTRGVPFKRWVLFIHMGK